MSLSFLSAALVLSSGVNLALTETSIGMLERGENPYALEGVKPLADKRFEDLPSLRGCLPKMSDGSSRQYIQIDYICEGNDGPFAHRVSFNGHNDGLLSIYIDPLPGALGPTAQALAAEDLISEKRQAFRFRRAVRTGDYDALEGSIPLNLTQIEELNTIADCDWRKPVKPVGKEPTWFMFVRCSFHERDKGRMVELQFNEEGQAVMVRVAQGSIKRSY